MTNHRIIHCQRALGPNVEGLTLVSSESFSPRYDLHRTTGVITRRGHSLYGQSIVGKILIFAGAKGGVAAGWAFLDLAGRGLAPLAILFKLTNPVMVQGCVAAHIAVMDQFSERITHTIPSGMHVRLYASERCVEVLEPIP